MPLRTNLERMPGTHPALERLNASLSGLKRPVLHAALLLLLVAITLLDISAGPDFSMAVLYGIPVAAATWYAGRTEGLVFAVLASIALVVGEVQVGIRYKSPLAAGWAVAAGLIALLVLVYLLNLLSARLEFERNLARIDELTGSLNKRAFQEELAYLLALHRREGKPLTLAYIDLDNFKFINDRHGHVAGDRTLRAVGSVLKEFARRTDRVTRLGGDEFALVLPDTTEAGAEQILSRMRDGFKKSFSPDAPMVTCSIGAITFLTPPESLEEALKSADELMYVVKRNGKNGVMYQTLP